MWWTAPVFNRLCLIWPGITSEVSLVKLLEYILDTITNLRKGALQNVLAGTLVQGFCWSPTVTVLHLRTRNTFGISQSNYKSNKKVKLAHWFAGKYSNSLSFFLLKFHIIVKRLLIACWCQLSNNPSRHLKCAYIIWQWFKVNILISCHEFNI